MRLLLFSFLFTGTIGGQEIPPKNFAVQLSAHVSESGEGGPSILLTWPSDPAATSYTISRRTMSTGWQRRAVVGGTAQHYADFGVITVGTKYEYQVIKETSAGYTGYGYIATGINLPLRTSFGKVILLVENSLAAPLSAELGRLQEDLWNEDWMVVRRDVGMSESPPMIKARIKEIYDADPTNVRAVFLLGHVAVPYSGNIAPDGHENHRGAWPADVYYADMDGMWSDATVNTTSAEREVNWNVPGDGKFDQSEIPSDVELWVGRVDLHNMTCYANKPEARSEMGLMRQYLNKNHDFRWGRKVIQRRALVCDNFSDKGTDPIGGSAWRNFPPFFHATNIVEVGWDGYLPAATSGSYLWSFASGGGSYYYSSGVATADDFALQDLRVVFTMFMGSYFGDWNNESNFLRAALGSGDVLTASYSGFPQALYFPMAMGEPIGYGIALTQNNGPGGLYPPWGQGTKQVHIALHGDPTLRMFPVKPPTDVTATVQDGIQVRWNAPDEWAVMGYEVFRGTSAQGPFAMISGSSPVTETAFYDPTGTPSHFYKVRTIKMEFSYSGRYVNASQPVLAANMGEPEPSAPEAPSNLSGVAAAPSRVELHWQDNSDDETGFLVERRRGPSGGWVGFTRAANTTTYSDTQVEPDAQYFYRVTAFNTIGHSAATPEIMVITPDAIPEPPSDFRGTAISPTRIRLQWTDNSDNEDRFTIYRKLAGGEYGFGMSVGWNTTSFTDVGLVPGTEYIYKIAASNSGGSSGFAPEISVSTPAAPAVSFVQNDAATSGWWKGNYGSDGGMAMYSDLVRPSYVQVNAYHNYPVVWENPSNRTSALQKRLSAERFATAWQHTSPFYFYLNFTDNEAHRVSFYFMDFETLGRVQKVEFFDYYTGALMGVTTVTNFQNGVYSTWELKGRVTVKMTPDGPGSAVLSGIFFDPLNDPVQPTNIASFVKSDATTLGSWRGVYGSAGAVAPYSDFVAPTFLKLNAYLNYPHVWEDPSARTSALQRRTSEQRFATCWQNNGSVYFYLQFTDLEKHRVSFYFHDFEGLGRRQKVEFLDWNSGALINGTMVESFQNGIYSTWDLRGRIKVKLTAQGTGSAVLSGMFFDSAGAAGSNAVRFIGQTAVADGNWKGKYGAQGFRLAADASSVPAFMSLEVNGGATHVWNDSTTDAAALERESTSGRIAACWYAAESVEVAVNITDGSTRKISFYSLDWDHQSRMQKIEVIDAGSGAVLHTTTYSGFENGVYHSYDVKGNVKFRFTRVGPLNAVLSAVFVDAGTAPL
jgi:hypothetical protein